MTPKEKLDHNKIRLLEFQREKSAIEQENITLISQNPELQMADMDKIRAAQQKAQMEAIAPKPAQPDVKGWS